MAANRGRTLAVMAHETGKTVREGDPEVSEAIDFATWAGSMHKRARRPGGRGHRRRSARRRARRRAVELPDGDPDQRRRRRPRRRQRRHPQAGSRGRRHRRRAGPPRARGGRAGRRRPARALPRRRRRPAPGDASRSRRRRADRLLRHRPPVPRVAPRSPPARRDERQELPRRQPDGRRRRRPARPRPVGVRPRRPEVLGSQPGDRRGAAVRRPVVPSPPCRCRAQPARRPGHGPGDDGRTGDQRAVGTARPRPHDARRRRGVAGRAAPDRRTALDARRAHRGPPGLVVPHDRMLRAGARRDARRRPRPRRRAAERRRLRTHRRAAQPRRGGDRALARAGRGGQRLRQPAHDRGDRPPPAVRRLEAILDRTRREDRWSRRHQPLRHVPADRTVSDSRHRVVRAVVGRALRARRSTAPACAARRTCSATAPCAA